MLVIRLFLPLQASGFSRHDTSSQLQAQSSRSVHDSRYYDYVDTRTALNLVSGIEIPFILVPLCSRNLLDEETNGPRNKLIEFDIDSLS